VTPVGGLALPFVFFTLFYLALGFFAGASLFTPFLLGVVLGAVSTRGVRADGLSSIAGGTGAWLALFPLSAGGMTLSSSAYLALGERHRAGGGSVLTPPLLGGFPSESVRTANPVQTARIYEVSNANPVGGGRQLTFSVPTGASKWMGTWEGKKREMDVAFELSGSSGASYSSGTRCHKREVAHEPGETPIALRKRSSFAFPARASGAHLRTQRNSAHGSA